MLEEAIRYLVEIINTYGALVSCLVITVESILPVLPLSVFITINFLVLGKIPGLLVSWIFTVIGCMISFYLFRKGFKKLFDERFRTKKIVENLMKIIDKIKFQYLVLLLAVPFVPAFAINIAAGISKIKAKKYFKALILGKLFMVWFWGFVGTNLVASLKDPIALIKVGLLVLVAYILSSFISKKFRME